MKACAPRERKHVFSQCGIALVVVLWMTILLSVMAASFAISMSTESRLTRNRVDVLRARYLAEAGIHLALIGLLHDDPGKRWPTDGAIRELSFWGANVRVSILDETGKIDLNVAPSPLLDGILRVSGVADEIRRPLVDAILDWRDKDQLRHPQGAEDRDYTAAGLSYGAKDEGFTDIQELRLVLGMTPELFRKLEPIVTVHSNRRDINPAVAPREVLLAMPGYDEAQVQDLIAARQAGGEQTTGSSGTPPGQARDTAPAAGTFGITAEARLNTGVTAGVAATVRLESQQQQPFTILAWKEGGTRLFADRPSASAQR